MNEIAAGDDGSVFIAGARCTTVQAYPTVVKLDPSGRRDVKFDGAGTLKVSNLSNSGALVALHGSTSSVPGAIDVMIARPDGSPSSATMLAASPCSSLTTAGWRRTCKRSRAHPDVSLPLSLTEASLCLRPTRLPPSSR